MPQTLRTSGSVLSVSCSLLSAPADLPTMLPGGRVRRRYGGPFNLDRIRCGSPAPPVASHLIQSHPVRPARDRFHAPAGGSFPPAVPLCRCFVLVLPSLVQP